MTKEDIDSILQDKFLENIDENTDLIQLVFSLRELILTTTRYQSLLATRLNDINERLHEIEIRQVNENSSDKNGPHSTIK